MKIQAVLCQSSNQTMILDYLQFHQIPCRHVDTWDPITNSHRVPNMDAAPSVLICNYELFGHFMVDQEMPRLLDFLRHHHLLVTQDTDGFTCILEQPLLSRMQCLNANLTHGNHVHLILDAMTTEQDFLAQFDRFRTVTQRYNWFMKHVPRIAHGRTTKNSASRDFLMTAINKVSRPHRAVLWQHMQQRPGLIERGHVWFKGPFDPWVGQQPVVQDWLCGHASMDLYLNSWCELVPETMHEHAHFVTEKTIKPLATKTPFFVVSTAGYLAYLRDLGFQTFHGIIDESYDQCQDLEQRVSLMLDELEKVIDRGAPQFYDACRDRLEHNHDHAMQIAGSYQFFYDKLLSDLLDRMVDQ